MVCCHHTFIRYLSNCDIDIETNIHSLSQRLQELNMSLEKKRGLKEEYASNINEISTAFTKILESSQTLLHVAKKESNTLEKKKDKIMMSYDKDDSKSSRNNDESEGKEDTKNDQE